MRLCGTARQVAARFEKFVQYVVFVGSGNQASYRQSHLLGDVSGADIAEIAAGYAEADFFAVALRGFEIAGEVVNHLGDDASPVDRVYRTDMISCFKSGIVLYGLYNILTIVKHAFYGNVVDIGILQAVHLRPLEGAHFAFGREHEDVDAFFAAQCVFCGGAGVAAGRAQDIEMPAFLVQHIFERVAQKLHRHIFKRQRRAVGQGLDFEAV